MFLYGMRWGVDLRRILFSTNGARMRLARRPITGGFSYLDIRVVDGALVLHEHDVGEAPQSIFGNPLDYQLTVAAGVPMAALLDRLGTEVGCDLGKTLEQAGLRRVGAAMLERFGADLNLVPSFRTWLKRKKIVYAEFVQ